MQPRTRVIAAAVPVAAVALIAAVQSYSHIEALALAEHQSLADARMLPLAIDGLVIAGAVVLLTGYALGWLGVGLGIAATLAANVASGLVYGPAAAVVAAWPAIAFSVASFILERWLKSQVSSAVQVPGRAIDESQSLARAPEPADPPPAVLNGHGDSWGRAPVTSW